MRSESLQQPAVPGWVSVAGFLGAMALLAIIVSNFNPHLLLHLALFLVGLAVVWRVSPAGEARTLIALYIVGYLVRLFAIVLVHQLAPGGLMFFDDRGYDEQARYLASGWSISNLAYASADLGTTHTGYPILVGTLYAFFGSSVFSAKMFSALFGALTAPVAFFLALEVTNDARVARRTAWLAALFLYDVMWAGFLMKDTVLLFLFTTTMLACIKLGKRQNLNTAASCVVLFAVLQLFRFYAIATILLSGVVALVVHVSQMERLRSRRTRLWSGLATFILTAICFSTVWTVYGDTINVFAVYAKAIDQFQAVPGSTYSLLQFSPSMGFLNQVVQGAVVYQLGPFPWIFSGVELSGMLFYPGMYITYGLLPLFLLGLGKMVREITPGKAFVLAALILHAAAEIFMYQAGERQRVMTDILFIVCAAVGWDIGAESRRFVIGTYTALAVFAFAHLTLRLV